MSLRHAVLAALLEGDASGYELAKRFDVSVADYWPATPQQVYRDVDRLAADGLVEARVVEQVRRPNKRVFSLTPAGRAELHDYTTRPARPPALRDEYLIKLKAVDAGDRAAVLADARARLERSRAKLARYDRMRDRLLGDRAEDEFLRSASEVGTYLTLMAGRHFEQLNIAWTTTVLTVLEARADH